MDILPDDLIVEVLAFLDIDSFFAARCVSRRFRDASDSRIGGISTSVAKNTFPGQTRVLIRRPDEPPDIVWLNNLRYRQLAAIVLECNTWSDASDTEECSLNAEDPLGDALREKVAKGFKVLNDFSRLSREVSALPAKSLRPINAPQSKFDPPKPSQTQIIALMKREYVLLDRCNEYISQLCAEDLQGAMYARAALLEPKTFHYNYKECLTETPIHDFELSFWAAWVFIKMGPQIFWDLWWLGRDAVSPNKSRANAILRVGEARKDHFNKFVECDVFCQVCFRFKNAEQARQIKAMVAIPSAGGELTMSVQSPRLHLYNSLKSRIRPLSRERQRRTQAGEEEEPPSLLKPCVPISQELKWNDMGLRGDPGGEFEYQPAPFQRTRLLRANTLDQALEYERQEKIWLDRERVFGRAPLPQKQVAMRPRQTPAKPTPLTRERTEPSRNMWTKIRGALKPGAK